MAAFLEQHELVKAVYYPGLESHAQHQRAADLCSAIPAGLFSFELAEGVDLWDFMNRFQVIVKSSNLGDNRTLGDSGGAHHLL